MDPLPKDSQTSVVFILFGGNMYITHIWTNQTRKKP